MKKSIFLQLLESVSKSLLGILPTFFFLFLIFGFNEQTIAAVTVLSAAAHEIGHLLSFFFIKGHFPSLRGVLSGFRIKSEGNLSYSHLILFYLFGPAVNIIISVISALLALKFGELFAIISVINLATAVSNLLPIEGYDGYGILRTFIESTTVKDSYLLFLSRLSSLLIFILCIFSLYFIDRLGSGYWIFAIFFFSMIKCIKSEVDK